MPSLDWRDILRCDFSIVNENKTLLDNIDLNVLITKIINLTDKNYKNDRQD